MTTDNFWEFLNNLPATDETTETIEGKTMLQFNRKQLLAAVKHVNKVTGRRVVQPVLASIKISASAVVGTDLDTWISVNVKALSESDREVVTPSKKLFEVLSNIATDVVTFEFNTNTDVTINGLKLESFPAEDFPRFQPVEVTTGETGGKVAFELTADELTRVLDQTAVFAASYDYSSILGGINFQGSEACATDGSRLSFTKLPVDTAVPFLLPAEVAIKKLQPLLKKAGKVIVTADNRLVEFTAESFKLQTRQISGQFPRYHELFPVSCNRRIVSKDRKALIASLKLLKAGIDERTNLLLVYSDGKAGNGSDVVDLPVEFEGEISNFAVNFNYLLQAIEALSTDTVSIEFHGSLKPLVLVEGEFKHLLMPVQHKKFEEEEKARKLQEAEAQRKAS
jgi:DNA polymerase-3 subunit beta